MQLKNFNYTAVTLFNFCGPIGFGGVKGWIFSLKVDVRRLI